jgi:radical SAM superfamily enzyme YgiQ (UPF0313 family)
MPERMGILPTVGGEGDENAVEKMEKKSVVLMTGTQMERPLRYLAGLVKEYIGDEYEVDILNLGTNEDLYKYKDGGYPAELRQEVTDFLIAKKPAVLGITMIDFGVERLSDLIRDIAGNEEIKKIGTKIIAGGPFAIEHSERCIDIEGIDVVCYATKGWHFTDMVQASAEGGDLESIPGLMIKTGVDENGKAQYIKTAVTAEILEAKLQDQPLADESLKNSYMIHRGQLVNEEESGGAIPVSHHQVPHKHTGVLVLSEGCPNDCNFCSIAAQFAQAKKLAADVENTTETAVVKLVKFGALKGDSSMEAIRNYLRENPKTEYLLFNDNDFFLRSPMSIADFSERYKVAVGLPFYCQGSPNTVSEDKIKSLVIAGLDTLDIGVQGSWNSNIAADYRREKCTDEQVLNLVRYAAPFIEKRDSTGKVIEDGKGIKLALDFIDGNEIHTRENMLSTLGLIRKINSKMDESSNGQGSWNLAIHNLTLDKDRELALEYRKKKEAAGITVGDVEDSDYHNATVDAFYKVGGEPYLNIVLEWMGGLHDQVRSGRLPRKTEDFAALIKGVLASEPELVAIIDRKKEEKSETVDFLTDDEVYAFLGGKENERAKAILVKISEKIPDIHYSYQRPDRYDYDYSWAESQIESGH